MSVFLSRGWNNSFQKHVRQSMSSPISETKHRGLIHLLEERPSKPASLVQFLEDTDHITAWGVKNKDYKNLKKMKAGDYHILRTEGNNPSSRTYEYIQQVGNIVDGESVTAPIRKRMSETIWENWEYEYMWFARGSIEVNCSEREFDALIQQVDPNFRTQNFFKSRNVNFLPINENIIEYFGSDEDFIDEIANP